MSQDAVARTGSRRAAAVLVVLYALLLTSCSNGSNMVEAVSPLHPRLIRYDSDSTDAFRRALAPNSISTDDDNITTPVIPVPTQPPGNHTNHTTEAPTATPAPTTLAPTTPETPAPTTLPPTPAPTKHYVAPGVPTHIPSPAPTPDSNGGGGGGISFFGIMGRLLSWTLVMALGVLAYGFCISHRYQIAYYLRHCGHCLRACNAWLIQKVRPDSGHSLQRGYASMFARERHDAQSMLLFESGGLFEPLAGEPNYNTDSGFVMGQHSNMNFSPAQGWNG